MIWKSRKIARLSILHRLRFIDGRPVMIQQSWLPHTLCPDILANDFANSSLFEVLAMNYNVRVVEGRQTISARLATREECRLLRLPEIRCGAHGGCP